MYLICNLHSNIAIQGCARQHYCNGPQKLLPVVEDMLQAQSSPYLFRDPSLSSLKPILQSAP